MNLKSSEIAKKNVGKAAADLVADGMTIGLGTGSTALFFIESLIERCRNGLKIAAVATSEESFNKAAEGGIVMRDINQLTSLDLTIDGADEVDFKKQMIKGGGGALLREKIVATMSREMIVIVDESKLKEALGNFPLPVEIVPFAHQVTVRHLNAQGYRGKLRQKAGQTYITDNGNYIYDIQLAYPCKEPEKKDLEIRSIPGVVETGFFLNLAGRVLVGYTDGTVKTFN